MKKLLPILVMLATIVPLQARILTVSNAVSHPAQYNSLTTALQIAIAFDTIYIHGSPTNYGDISLYYPLTLIGTGHNPQKLSPLTSMLGRVGVYGHGTTQLIGLNLSSVDAQPSMQTDTLHIKRCRIQVNGSAGVQTNHSGVIIVEGCIIEAPYTAIVYSAPSQIIIQNNVLYGPIVNLSPPINGLAHIRNNIFLGPLEPFSSIYNAIIENNIFDTGSPIGISSAGQTVMRNNMGLFGYGSFPWPGDQPASNNIFADPVFVNAIPNIGMLFRYTNDYHLASNSPGIGMGSDGKDIGIYGGNEFLFTMSGEPGIALITEFTFTSPTTIPPGGTLTISVRSKSTP